MCLMCSGVLTMRPSVASPSSPPKVITGDMQAQYRNRKEAKHCRLSASVKSDSKCGAFLFTSRNNPPKSLTKNTRHKITAAWAAQRGGKLHSYTPQRITCKINTHQAISFHQAILFITNKTIISKTIITIMQKIFDCYLNLNFYSTVLQSYIFFLFMHYACIKQYALHDFGGECV